MQYLIEEFIEDTNQATSRDEAFALYQKAIAQYGYNSAVYTLVTDHPLCGQKAGHGVKSNFPDGWMEHYRSSGYEKIDPVTHYVLQTPQPFTWRMLEQKIRLSDKQIMILNEAAEAGLNDGVGIPLYGPMGQLAGVGLASTEKNDIRPDKNILCILKLVTEQFHLVYCDLSAERPEVLNSDRDVLTQREKEVLKWWAIGKTADEIGCILNCSRSNVKFHVNNIYSKLNANSKILAVTKAIRLGLVPLDTVRVSAG